MDNIYILLTCFLVLISSCEPITEISKGSSSLIYSERVVNYEEPPGIKNLEAYNITDTKIYLKWDISNEEYSIKGYNIEWNGDVLWATSKLSAGKFFSSERQTVIFSLIPYTNYSVKVTIVYNSENTGHSDELFGLKTLEGEPGSPETLSVHRLSSSNINVSWTDPLEANGNLSNFFLVNLQLSGESEMKTIVTSKKYIEINGLFSCGDYELGVQASTKIGFGRQALVQFEAFSDTPPNVENLDVTDVSSRTVNLTWSPLPTRCPYNYSFEIQKFILWNNETNKTTLMFPGKNSFLYLEDLTPWTSYNVCMSAVSVLGQSNFTCIDFETLEDAPGQPANLTVDESNIGFTHLTIAWSAPAIKNGEVLYFRVVGNNKTNLISYEGPDFFYKYTFEELEQDHKYFFEVSARTKACYGLPSQTTAETIPDYHIAISLGITLFVFLTCIGFCFGCYFRNKLKARRRRKKKLEAESQMKTRF